MTKYRVYINSFEENRNWSVDRGDISTEQKVDSVVILGRGYTRVDMSKRGSKTEPCCWIELFGNLRIDEFGGSIQATIE